EYDIQVWGACYPDGEKTRTQQELATEFQQLWDSHAPESYRGIPYCRDTYQQKGYEDDAMLLTRELYDALLKEYEGKEEFERVYLFERRSYWIPGSWNLRMVYTDDILFPDP